MRDLNRMPGGVQVIALGVLVGCFSIFGCAADRPTSSSPTQKEIRADSDRFHEKMKQEERDHGKGTEPAVR
jgi:hypothetical protein